MVTYSVSLIGNPKLLQPFYIKMITSISYDILPAEDAPEKGYVFITGFGWEWDF